MFQSILILPGWQNSESDHWQSIWEKKLGAERVEQSNWMFPKKEDWVNNLHQAISKSPSPPFVITHSLGGNTLISWALKYKTPLAGALIVAPTDLTGKNTPDEIKNFYPTPLERLHFPSTVVASSTDPYCSSEKSKYFSDCWGSHLINIGDHGHINISAGFGDWPEGFSILEEMLNQQKTHKKSLY